MTTDRLKILMVAPTPYFSDRGCHVRIFEEARALRSRGHEVHICTYHLGRDMAGIPTWRIPRVPWYRKRSAGPSWHKPYLDFLLFFTSLRVARKLKPDLIHAHLHEGAFIGFFLKKLLGIPMVFDCQGSLCGELVDHGFIREGSLLFRIFRRLEREINTRADRIVTSSTPTAALLLAQFGLPEEKVDAVIDGVDTGEFRPAIGASPLRRELGLPEEKRIVVFLGAMNEYQGVDLLLEAIKLLSRRAEPLHLLLMGYPAEKYVEQAISLGIADMVTFTGRIDYSRAPEYLCLGDLAVSPKLSRTEANGKLFNYMACGLPTVVFETPVNREILGELGVYASFGDAESLADHVAGLARDGERLTELGRSVREKAVSDYSWQVAAEKLERTYHFVQSRCCIKRGADG